MAGKQASGGTQAGTPILNGPYDEPAFHCATTPEGNLDCLDKRGGRRIFSPDTMLAWHFLDVTDLQRNKNQLTDEFARTGAELDERADVLHLMAAQQPALTRIWDNEADEIWNDQ